MSKVVDEDMAKLRKDFRILMEHPWILLTHCICYVMLLIFGTIEERCVLKAER